MESAWDLFLQGFQTGQSLVEKSQAKKSQQEMLALMKAANTGDTTQPPTSDSGTPPASTVYTPAGQPSDQAKPTDQTQAKPVPGGTDFWKGQAPTDAQRTDMAAGKDLTQGMSPTMAPQVQPTQQATTPHEDWLNAHQKVQDYSTQIASIDKKLTLASTIQSKANTLDQFNFADKLKKDALTEKTSLLNQQKEQQSIIEKQNEQYAGILTNINSQQDLNIAKMQLQKNGVQLPASIQVPRMNPDGTPILMQNGQPVMDQLRTDVYSPQLKQYANSLGMSLLDANKQMTLRNQMSEIQARSDKQGQTVAGTFIGTNDPTVFKGLSGAEITPRDDKEKRLIANLNQPVTKPAAYQVGRNSAVSTMAEEIASFSETISKSVKNSGLSEAGMFGGLKDNTWVSAIGKRVGIKITDPDKQSYSAIMKPLSRMASTLETAGYGQGGGAAQIEALNQSITAQPGQDELTKLQKIGEAANIVKAGLMGASENTSFNPAQREGIARAYQDWNKLIPFNQNDVQDFKEYAKENHERANLKNFQEWLGTSGRSFAEKTPSTTTATPASAKPEATSTKAGDYSSLWR